MHVCRIQEGCIWHSKGITTILQKKLSKKPEQMGYRRNEYDWCFRKNIEGKQYTIPWHVDDMNIFHVVSNILSSIISGIGEEHGKISRMTITRGKIKNIQV